MRIKLLLKCAGFQGYREDIDGGSDDDSTTDLFGNEISADQQDLIDAFAGGYGIGTDAISAMREQEELDAWNAARVSDAEAQAAASLAAEQGNFAATAMALDNLITKEGLLDGSYIDNSYGADFTNSHGVNMTTGTLSNSTWGVSHNTHFHVDGTEYGYVAEAVADIMESLNMSLSPSVAQAIDTTFAIVGGVLTSASVLTSALTLTSILTNWKEYKALIGTGKTLSLAAFSSYSLYASIPHLTGGNYVSSSDIDTTITLLGDNSGILLPSATGDFEELLDVIEIARGISSNSFTDLNNIFVDPFEYHAGGDLYNSRMAGNSLYYGPEPYEVVGMLDQDIGLSNEGIVHLYGEEANIVNMLPLKYN